MVKDVIYKIWIRIRNFIFMDLFPFWQSLGFHLTLNHFYQPIPDTRFLKNTLWGKTNKLAGINMEEKRQLRLMTNFIKNFRMEINRWPLEKTNSLNQYFVYNIGFETVDAEILYCMIRHFKPKLIYEIGSGMTTLLIIQALLENQKEGFKGSLKVIDPYPGPVAKRVVSDFYASELIISKVEDLDLNFFKKLNSRDLLFIDSTHVLKIGGDVYQLINEILPRLNVGVVIHFHDIFMPSEYPKDHVMERYYFYTEQYILQAFLSFNNSFEILWSSSLVHLKYPDLLKESFKSYDYGLENSKRIWPASLWIRRKK